MMVLIIFMLALLNMPTGNFKPCYALSIIIIIYHNPAIYSHSPQLRMKNNLRRTDIQAASKSPSLPMPTPPCNK